MADGEAGSCPLCNGPSPQDTTDSTPAAVSSMVVFGISMAVLSGIMVWLNSIFDVLSFKTDPGQILYALIFVGFVSVYIASGRTAAKLKGLLAWAGIFLMAMLVYTYRHDLAAVKNRMLGALIPEFGTEAAERALQFHVGADGHFHIRARVNDVPIRFLVDTGASHIVLTPRDAKSLGLDRERLVFDKIYATANGMVRGASIQVDDFRIGDLHLKDVNASVNEAPMHESLLGMTFFNRLERFTVEGGMLTIHWAAP
ncbi:MAG: TIGR02281 family clan AA aspartic protease [Desulfobacterales bacterium]|nr:TIGR02281 family clan AA aspartic protease [Desulfobacterales bacterium]